MFRSFYVTKTDHLFIVGLIARKLLMELKETSFDDILASELLFFNLIAQQLFWKTVTLTLSTKYPFHKKRDV